MNITSWYTQNYETKISGRYVHLEPIREVLKLYENEFEILEIGTSQNGEMIPYAKMGNGKKVVLAWSQMHGNESTTTKAIFDFFKFIVQKRLFQIEIKSFLENHTFYVIPILNPDGAKLYTRENANKVDLNRDAKDKNELESKCLRRLFDAIKPNLCLNLHDQRTIYSLPGQNTATISFLAPSANPNRTLTLARKTAMGDIVRMVGSLQKYIPNQIGRYDDTYNENCVGDTFQSLGVPTILFEAGHTPNDYQREKTREYIFYALLALFKMDDDATYATNYKDYFLIPENEKRFRDLLIKNVRLEGEKELVSLVIQYEEILEQKRVHFIPKLEAIDVTSYYYGHREIDVAGAEILINSHENVFVNMNVATVSYKNAKNQMIFQQSEL